MSEIREKGERRTANENWERRNDEGPIGDEERLTADDDEERPASTKRRMEPQSQNPHYITRLSR